MGLDVRRVKDAIDIANDIENREASFAARGTRRTAKRSLNGFFNDIRYSTTNTKPPHST